MPVRDTRHWTERLDWRNPCHYGDRWLDAYADRVRKAAIRRVWPKGVTTVLDAGCGDGRLGAWMQRAFNCVVWGVDAYEWPGAEDRLHRFNVWDMEELPDLQGLAHWPDLAVAVTSLPFTRDWRRAVRALCRVAPRVMVVDNLQTPAPPWQKGLPEKEPIELPALEGVFRANGFKVERAVAVNVLDRRLFLRCPKWAYVVPFAVTLAADLALARVTAPHRARYAAVLFRRVA